MSKPRLAPSRRRSSSDPLTAALAPPPNESFDQRERRLKAEGEAKRVSDGIDEMIRQERNAKKKAREEVNVLLLGQSESGKSTTLKQFQLLHTPAAFHAERIAWRAELMDLYRILEALSPEYDVVDDHDEIDFEPASVIISSSGLPPSALRSPSVPNFESYRLRLAPLVELEEHLTRLLSSPDEEEPIRLPPYPNLETVGHIHGYGAPTTSTSSVNGVRKSRPSPTISIPRVQQSYAPPSPPTNGNGSISAPASLQNRSGGKEVSVHTSVNWKKTFALGGKSKSPKSAHSGEIEGWWEDPDDPVHTLNACSSAMIELWKDPKVRQQLREKRLRLEESSGFYLDDMYRITAKKYIPTDSDVLKARLKTTGVIEHTFSIPQGTNKGVVWRIYDVGGSRNQRQAWAPYFEHVNAIIFLAPISAFDQILAEDPRVNRLEDSLLLWRSVISNKLLANVNIVLFLNKCDLLQAKLEAGVRLNKHLMSYGDRPNDYESVSKYFRHKFVALHQLFTPNKERELYIHHTAVTDTRRTAIIISSVRDIIIKVNLHNMRLV